MMITVEQFELIQRMAKVYATTIYKAYSIDVIMTMMLRAHGLGLPVTEAPELFQQLHGKLTLSANAMATLIKRAGYSWIVNSLDDDRAELTIYDNAGHELGQSIFTIEDAQQAGIMGKNKNWDNYPRNMLMARALSNAAKWFAPDAFGGAPLYTPDELGSDDDAGYTDIADDTEPTPPNVTDIAHAETVIDTVDDLFNPAPPLPPKSYLREDHWDGRNHLAGSSTKMQRTTIGTLASRLFGSNKEGKATKAKYVNEFVKQDGVEHVDQLSEYDAEWFWVLLSIERTGREIYGDQWETEKRASAVKAYTEDVTAVLWDMPRKAACKLLDRLERERLEKVS